MTCMSGKVRVVCKKRVVQPWPFGSIFIIFDEFRWVGRCLIGLMVILRFNWTDSQLRRSNLDPIPIIHHIPYVPFHWKCISDCILTRTAKLYQYASSGSNQKKLRTENWFRMVAVSPRDLNLLIILWPIKIASIDSISIDYSRVSSLRSFKRGSEFELFAIC